MSVGGGAGEVEMKLKPKTSKAPAAKRGFYEFRMLVDLSVEDARHWGIGEVYPVIRKIRVALTKILAEETEKDHDFRLFEVDADSADVGREL